jgi:methyl-accepting chemotaxis protein
MNVGNQMNVGKKISLACAFLVALTAIVASIALYRVGDIQRNLLAITNQSLPGVYSVGKLAQLNRVMTGNMLLHIGVPSVRPAMETKIQSGQREFAGLFQELGKTITTPQERHLYDAIPPVYSRLCAAWDKIRPISNADRTAKAWKIWLAEGRPAMLDLELKLNTEIDFSRTAGGQNASATMKSVHNARVWILGFLIFAVVSGGGLAFLIVRRLNLQLHRSARTLAGASVELAATAAQVASSSQSLAQGASEQAASLEQTSAATEELTAMTRSNTQSARLASDAMSTVDQQVATGNHTLQDMLVSMAEIEAASNKISKIVKTIDGIAFQTNILALNAAVEAARAGQAGAGFAVVADEVRNLARRSADAAKETAALIEESAAKSTQGSSRAEQVARTIGSIAESAGRAKSLVEAVHRGSEEQTRGIEQIAQAMVQMDKVTQQTAAGAEESAAASQMLAAQAAGLKEAASGLGALVGAERRRRPRAASGNFPLATFQRPVPVTKS